MKVETEIRVGKTELLDLEPSTWIRSFLEDSFGHGISLLRGVEKF